MTIATVIDKAIGVDNFYNGDGIWFAEVKLDIDTYKYDYTAYKSLPVAIKINGITLVKSAFNSEKHIAYYNSKGIFATV
jgi:hypothetical protein